MPIVADTHNDVHRALQRRFEELESRLEMFERRLTQLEVLGADIERLKELTGDLKFELEQMRE